MVHIKVWCEYDFCGSFGGNNNEEVFVVEDDLDGSVIDARIGEYLVNTTNISEEDLEGLWDWNFINISKLG